jgi:hypothetical protein
MKRTRKPITAPRLWLVMMRGHHALRRMAEQNIVEFEHHGRLLRDSRLRHFAANFSTEC